MDVTRVSTRHFRVRAAKYQGWFKGKRLWFWRLITLVLAGLLGASYLLSWPLAVTLWSAALLLLLSQLWFWWKLYLQNMPADIEHNDIIQRSDAAVLRHMEATNEPRELWKRLLEEWPARFIFNRLLLDPQELVSSLPDTPDVIASAWQDAETFSRASGATGISSGAFAVALLFHVQGVEAWLQQHELQPSDVKKVLDWQTRTEQMLIKIRQKPFFGGVARDWAAGYTPVLNRFSHDMSSDIEHGTYQHLYLQTHSAVLEQMQARLEHPTQSSVALIGKTGSGKTSLAYALAEKLLSGGSKKLRYAKLFAVDASAIVSEANRSGNLEALMLRLIHEANKARNIVLFFDDAHSFFAQEAGASDMSNLLLQILQTGAIKIIFALNPDDWQYLVSSAPDITAYLQPMQVGEPDEEAIKQVLQDQALLVEVESKVSVSYQAIQEAYRLAARYTLEQAFPGKGISLLKSATANAYEGWVLPQSVQKTVESMTGAKVAIAGTDERDTLLHLEERIHEQMVNQDFAVRVVADALRRARAGVRNQNRPIGSFLFLGPTGVGKTELSKALAATYFGGSDRIVRVDMSEYNRPESTQRLLAPAGNPGTFLTNVRTNPFSVVLLDEIEKASDEVLNLLLQMLDEGGLTDTDGLEVSFKDAIVITTSNAGADTIRANIEAGRNLEDFSTEFVDQLINDQHFKPELINRFDEVVLFRPLEKTELLQVLRLLLDGINQNLAARQITVQVTEAAAQVLVEQGYDPRLGARPMRRVVQRTVENTVAKRMLEGSLKPGDTAILDVGDLEQV